MKPLWLAFIAVATFGSLYPFDFDLSGPPGGALRALLDSAADPLSRGDVVGNFVLFLPIGLTGMLALNARFGRTLTACVALALTLQLIQLYLPSRNASLLDVVWNAGGAFAGASLASLVQRESTPMAARLGGAAFVPLALIACWLAYRLVPFVPSIDFQLLKDSLKPLVDAPLDPVSCVRDAAGWVVTAYLISQTWKGARLDLFLPLLMVLVLGLEVLIVANAVDRADVAGALIAAFLWFGFLRRLRRPEGPVVLLLAGTIALSGLAPFTAQPDAVPFHWVPFRGFLGGSMYVNAQSALEKTFLYGSLVFVIQRVSSRRITGVIFAFLFVGLIEFAQTRVVGHSPEITDPLLVILASFALLALEKHDSADARFQPHGATRATESAIQPLDSRRGQAPRTTGWVKLAVALRPERWEALGRLAEEWGVSVSGATRRAIASSVGGAHGSAPGAAAASLARPLEEKHGLVTETVNLQGDHFEALLQLAHDSGKTVESLTRSMVNQFLDRSGNDDHSTSPPPLISPSDPTP